MQELAAYRSVEEILNDRITWATAMLGELVMGAREDGWLEGTPSPTPSSCAIAERIAARERLTPRAPARQPITWLATRLGLTPREVDALWLLICTELHPRVARLADTFATIGCAGLSIQLLMFGFQLSSRDLAHLRQLRLIDESHDESMPLHRRFVRAHDRVLDLARGDLGLDARLTGIATLHAKAERVAECPFTSALLRGDRAVLVATGSQGCGRATMLAGSAAALGLGTLRVASTALAETDAALASQIDDVLREATLFDAIPLFEDLDERPVARACLERRSSQFLGPILISSRAPIAFAGRPIVIQPIALPDATAREQIWRTAMPTLSPAAARVVADFALTPGAILASAANAAPSLITASPDSQLAVVQAGISAYLGNQLEGLATRVECTQTWEDLVIPSDHIDQIIELIARVRRRKRVLDDWGFARKVGKGRGVAALMSGPPGTGKTMAAGLVAKELGLDLMQVDLSKIVSKYIGETEKQLGAIFDAAESGHFVLLFDEADSLFGKRSEVKSSNDRYANLEVNYLLQRLESFDGIAILTTNHENAIDEAFRRRLAAHLRFPMPDEVQRAHLWEAMIPNEAAVARPIDFDMLGQQFSMTGGYIKNAVLRAAYLAADEGNPIGLAHLLKGARGEYDSLGKISHLAIAA